MSFRDLIRSTFTRIIFTSLEESIFPMDKTILLSPAFPVRDAATELPR